MSTTLDKTENSAKNIEYHKPAYRVREESTQYVVEVEIPGVNQQGVDIELEKQLLTVTATRNVAIPSDWQAVSVETSHKAYRLALTMNVKVDESAIQAAVDSGLLTLILPKSESVIPRKIEVN